MLIIIIYPYIDSSLTVQSDIHSNNYFAFNILLIFSLMIDCEGVFVKVGR